MAKLVDAHVSEACELAHESSTLSPGTMFPLKFRKHGAALISTYH